ncbi:uncharacterized protein BJ171DRAFT_525953 [Polychytrium aggregatum]|uniref:uncharacterized protein n=1 Tax=Polychytrium aggregatum TaxID=110093 RepID=UPI0022FE911C|nr:uncharacterized protein BJ171DRAFT_525953 [Polychytrium aggregatum]KAI9193516.1 hypothetical protein BJ171DRAFT_525953 [Polychytrium aggregatum]
MAARIGCSGRCPQSRCVCTDDGSSLESLFLVVDLSIDYLGPVEWTKLGALSSKSRRVLSAPMYWRIIFRNYFGLSVVPSLEDPPSRPEQSLRSQQPLHRPAQQWLHRIVVGADAFLNRLGSVPYPCESHLWRAVSRSPVLLAQVKTMCMAHEPLLFRRWPHSHLLGSERPRRLYEWERHGTLPDSVGLYEMASYGLYGCQLVEVPETICFWNPTKLIISSKCLKRLPLSMGCMLTTLEQLAVCFAPFTHLPESFAVRTSLPVLQSASPGCDRSARESAGDPNEPTVEANDLAVVEHPLPEHSLPNRLVATLHSPPPSVGSLDPPLKLLDLAGSSLLESIDPIAGLGRLTQLSLSGCKSLSSITALVKLSALTSLNLEGCCQLTSLAPLSGLQALADLTLTGCVGLESIDPLAGLIRLENLFLNDCIALRSIDPIVALPRLAILSISGCSALEPSSKMGSMVSLRELDVHLWNRLDNVEWVAGLKNLRRLNLVSSSRLRSLAPLEHATSLQVVLLGGCCLLDSLEPLGRLPALRLVVLCPEHQIQNQSGCIEQLSAMRDEADRAAIRYMCYAHCHCG